MTPDRAALKDSVRPIFIALGVATLAALAAPSGRGRAQGPNADRAEASSTAQEARRRRYLGRPRACHEVRRISEAHAVACVCASEVGLAPRRYRRLAETSGSTPTELFRSECAAVGYALKRRAQILGRSLRQHLLLYSGVAFQRGRTNRAWLPYLRSDARIPVVWPPDVSWRVRQPWWRLLLDTGEQVVRGEIADPCGGRAEHWGGPCDDERAESHLESGNWERLDCGPTRNRFYHVRRRDPVPPAPGEETSENQP